MKKSLNILLAAIAVVFSVMSCDKADDLASYENGNATVLSASVASLAPLPADSNNVVVTFNWTYPNHATDSNNIKYIVEIDSVTKNFSSPYRKEVVGELNAEFSAKELNAFLLNKGYAFNTEVSMEARVVSSYVNNNERIASNTVAIKMKAYKVPPKVALPTTGKLFIVGGATQGGWNNPVPTPTQELARLDETTWAGIFQMNAGEQYLLLPLNGDWDNKFSVASSSLPGLEGGGDFGFNLPGNIPGPTSSGWYKIIVDFQTGKFKVTPYTSTLPTNLYMVGDATPGGWNNPVPVPSQQLTRINSSQWKGTINFTGGNTKYIFLLQNGSWDFKYAVPDNSITDLWKGGEILYNSGADVPGPPTAGTKTVLVDFATKENFATGKFTVTP